MFSEALTHPLYTLNCTVLPPAFCDWLFNSEVEKVDSADVQKLLDSHNQELTVDELIEMDEQGIEELEFVDPVQSEDHRMMMTLFRTLQSQRCNYPRDILEMIKRSSIIFQQPGLQGHRVSNPMTSGFEAVLEMLRSVIRLQI
ncbi:hypothetical protein TNCV_1703581 [Trichonephila clavipes]|nr:hypothetical protein TNCV_1703581 [Trichonephila clavipes]